MEKLKRPFHLETAFASYELTEVIGEGGAGRVYGGTSSDGQSVAVKVLSADRATSDKRKRFKNEIDFLARTTHPNLVKVSDYGLSQVKSAEGPFYVMRRYKCSLRGLMQTGISHEEVMPLFISILNGLEAAHLKRAVHRDLKPENMLCDESGSSLAIADFGVARFSADDLLTAVETRDAQRLANFLYAAPEQREKGKDVGAAADIYALGLILNELFTGSVPHGTDYKQISSVAPDFAFLDPIVARMLRQSASDRPTSIAELKKLISVYQSEAIAQQKLSSMDGAVIPQGQIDDPLALVPPKLVGVDWVEGTLILKLDRQVHQQWVWALNNMRNFSSIMGAEPHQFSVRDDTARVACNPNHAQPIINSFKEWLPKATERLREELQRDIDQQRQEHERQRRFQREAEEARLKVLRSIEF